VPVPFRVILHMHVLIASYSTSHLQRRQLFASDNEETQGLAGISCTAPWVGSLSSVMIFASRLLTIMITWRWTISTLDNDIMIGWLPADKNPATPVLNLVLRPFYDNWYPRETDAEVSETGCESQCACSVCGLKRIEPLLNGISL
jgi:hypothetical protein